MKDIALSRCRRAPGARSVGALSVIALALAGPLALAGCRPSGEGTSAAHSAAPVASPPPPRGPVPPDEFPRPLASASASARPPRPAYLAPPAPLAAAFERAERESQGHLGVAALHVATGERFSFHGGERFPLQSVFKLPLAIAMLTRVDVGDVRMDEKLEVRPIDLRPGPSGALADELPPTGGEKTVEYLIERTLLGSDNTAADVLLERLGGPQRINERLGALGLFGIDVSRSEAELMMDFVGVSPHPPRATWTLPRLREIMKTPPATRTKALAAALADPRDTATPEALAELLLRVHQKDLLKPASATWLLDTLGRVKTGKNRLRGLLPEGTPVAHKTGTSDETDGVTEATNDVGIVTLPGSGGAVVVAVLLKAARGNEAARERAIAQSARAVFDHYAPKR